MSPQVPPSAARGEDLAFARQRRPPAQPFTARSAHQTAGASVGHVQDVGGVVQARPQVVAAP